MREVSACDFCGGDAAGTFEVLPPEVDGGRRMVLCPGCRDTLDRVLEPLLARDDEIEPGGAGAAGGADGGAATAADDAGDEGGDAAGPETGDGAAEGADGTATAEDGARAAASGADESDEDGDADGSAPSRPPHGYRKVVRFLQNREFPLDRTEAVSMVSDAYALEPTAVEAAIDHAVDEGRFSESGGQLRG